VRSAEVVVWWVLLMAAWLATVNAVSTEEVVAAAIFSALGALAARAGRRVVHGRWHPPADARRWASALPSAVVRDAVGALRTVLRGDPEGRFEWLALTRERDAGRRAGREAVATATVSATPGSVVVDAAEQHDQLLLHRFDLPETRLVRLLRR
jgi:multisubunit Na+/H+ antiporter MnhE subunit